MPVFRADAEVHRLRIGEVYCTTILEGYFVPVIIDMEDLCASCGFQKEGNCANDSILVRTSREYDVCLCGRNGQEGVVCVIENGLHALGITHMNPRLFNVTFCIRRLVTDA